MDFNVLEHFIGRDFGLACDPYRTFNDPSLIFHNSYFYSYLSCKAESRVNSSIFFDYASLGWTFLNLFPHPLKHLPLTNGKSTSIRLNSLSFSKKIPYQQKIKSILA